MQSASVEETKREFAVVVLAAGLGTRMKSKTPKVLHPICGRPIISWVCGAVGELKPDHILVVLAPDVAEEVHRFLPQEGEVVIQERQLGTGDAVRASEERLKEYGGDIMVLCGDAPLVTADSLKGMLGFHRKKSPACTLMTVEAQDPSHYGRVIRDSDGRVVRIIEDRDAGPEEKKINEVNGGIYIFEAASLWPALELVGNENVQGEVYFTDVVEIMASKGLAVMAYMADDPSLTIGVNSRLDLARAEKLMQQRILAGHMLSGVTVTDPDSTYVEADVKLGRDTVLEPMTILRGSTSVGEGCVIGPSSTLINAAVDDNANIVLSFISGAQVGEGCLVGPFAYLRPGARLEAGSKAGSFVEIKNSVVGKGSKVPHLSYVGDAEIGEETNIGAGNITANYDGVSKHRTVIGSRVHTGADTVFVAPVTVGDGSLTGAGSVITNDVPSGDLGISRCRQKNIEGYAKKKFGQTKEKG